MTRKTYFPDDVLRDIAARLKFGGVSLEDRVAKIPVPELPEINQVPHVLDKIALEMGITGRELEYLLSLGFTAAETNPLVAKAMRDFVMVTKLVHGDEFAQYRVTQNKILEDKRAQDSSYRKKMNEYERKKQKIEDDWIAIRQTIQTRWKRMIKSLDALLKINDHLDTMDPRDQFFLKLLEQRGYVIIQDSRVEEVAWERLRDQFSIEDIKQIILEMDEDQTGRFTQPSVSKFEIVQLD